MNAPASYAIAYWLIPAAPALEFFRETIRRLAAKCDAPIFEPHLTLAVQPDSSDAAGARLAKLPGDLVELRSLEIGWTSKFTKTLFVRFDFTPFLGQLRTSLGGDAAEDFDPHLSLLYKKSPEPEQALLAAEIRLPFASVTFDTVAATYCRLPVEAPADVAHWKPVAVRRLDR